MDPGTFRGLVEEFIRRHDLIRPRGDVTVLVSSGPDSTCLWHVLNTLGYRVSALHVDHGLRGDESAADARFCRDVLGAEVVDGRGAVTEDDLRAIRYAHATDRLRATAHTRDDQVETVLFRVVTSGRPGKIKAKREDGVVRPLLDRRRDEVRAYLAAEQLPFRLDSSNRTSKRGLIREHVLPLLRQLHPAADENLLRLADRATVRPEVAELLRSTTGSKRLDLGGGLTLVREYDAAWVEPSPRPLDGIVRWGEWEISSAEKGLKVRPWRPGDRLAGRTKKIQDVFVDAKIPPSARETWPLVVRGDEVVAVPGIVDAPGVKVERVAD